VPLYTSLNPPHSRENMGREKKYRFEYKNGTWNYYEIKNDEVFFEVKVDQIDDLGYVWHDNKRLNICELEHKSPWGKKYNVLFLFNLSMVSWVCRKMDYCPDCHEKIPLNRPILFMENNIYVYPCLSCNMWIWIENLF